MMPTRRIPVHPELIRLGFLDFVERQRAARQARLFPELTAGKYGSASAQFSKRFGRLLRSIGITDKRKALGEAHGEGSAAGGSGAARRAERHSRACCGKRRRELRRRIPCASVAGGGVEGAVPGSLGR